MELNNLSFTVVIPTFNSATFIDKAIKSCLEQTMLPNEVIIIDDHSTDNTIEVVNLFNSNLIKIFINEKNMGPSYSRNIGIKESNSDWILFLDADDIFHFRKIETLFKILNSNKHIQAIGHNCVVGVSQNELNLNMFAPSIPKIINKYELLMRNKFVTPSIGISKKNKIYFNEKMKYAEDHDFILNTSRKYNFYFIDYILCSINRRPLSEGGLSSKYHKMRIGEINMYKNYCRNNKIYLLFPLLLTFSIAKHIVFIIKKHLIKSH